MNRMQIRHHSIGFVGLGMMGFPMAGHLSKAFGKIAVVDTVPAVTQRFLKEHPNATVASSPKELAKTCNVIISMVPSPAIVKNVFLGENGVLQGLQPGSLLIDSSTIGPAHAREIGKALNGKPCDWVDAPVSGGVPGAVNATLTFMVTFLDKGWLKE